LVVVKAYQAIDP